MEDTLNIFVPDFFMEIGVTRVLGEQRLRSRILW